MGTSSRRADTRRGTAMRPHVRRVARRLADLMTVLGFRAAWALVRLLPERWAYGLFGFAADRAYAAGDAGIAQLRANLQRIRPDLTGEDLEATVREGVRRYLRYYCAAFRLPALTRERVLESVVARNDAAVRAELAAGRPVVCFLGHIGNWDLAGAWCVHALGPVITVAERLQPEEVFVEFLRFRESLGMRIFALGDGDVFDRLGAVLHGPVVMPLLSDRDLTSTGVTVDLRGHPARVAAGPAALAVDHDAALFPVSMREWPRPDGGYGIEVTFHDRVYPPEIGTARERIHAATQACVDSLGEAMAAHPEEWHMMQAVFVEDLDPQRLARAGGATP